MVSLQSLPPAFGGGFVQVRDRIWAPPPHVALHSDQLVHSV